MHVDRSASTITLTYTGSGKTSDFRILLPAGWTPKTLTVAGRIVDPKVTQMDASRYIEFQVPLAGVGRAILTCEHSR